MKLILISWSARVLNTHVATQVFLVTRIGNDEFRRDMLKWLSLTNLQKKEFDRFIYLTSKLLDRHYQALFMSTNLHKTTLTHS